MPKLTQNEQILRHLHDIGTITPLQALGEYGIMRLASRVSDLRRQGYPIEKRMVRSRNRYGEPVRYAEYRLEGSNGLPNM